MEKMLCSGIQLLIICASLFLSQKGMAQEQTGAMDRAYWTNLLYKISKPVIEHVSTGTLIQAMPLEKAPGYGMNPSKVSYLEAVGRTMVGIAPWLALPDDESPEGLMRKELRNALLKGLPNLVNPSHPDYLNFRTEMQPIVDAAFMAHAFLRAPDQLWKPLDSLTKQRFITEFQSLRNRKAYQNNWLLFSGITEAFLLQIGASSDSSKIQLAYRKFKEWYVGDGLYKDGEKFAMDYYNAFVIHSMLVDMEAIMVAHQMIEKAAYEEAVKRMIRYAELQERMISPEGTYPVIGRSLTYRIGAFQTLAQVSLLEKLPASIQPAQVRSALTKIMQNQFDAAETFSKEGWLQLGLVGHQPEIADTYTSTGSLYLCTTGFLALGLPANNPFWTAPAADWTSKKAWKGKPVKKDYKVDY